MLLSPPHFPCSPSPREPLFQSHRNWIIDTLSCVWLLLLNVVLWGGGSFTVSQAVPLCPFLLLSSIALYEYVSTCYPRPHLRCFLVLDTSKLLSRYERRCSQLCVDTRVYFPWVTGRRGTAKSYVKTIFHFRRNGQIPFPSDSSTSHSHQHYVRIPLSHRLTAQGHRCCF